MTVTVDKTSTTAETSIALEHAATYFVGGENPRVPLTMPTDQEYYWHYEWQRGEREALSELRRGLGVRFDSNDPEDAARWLDEADAGD